MDQLQQREWERFEEATTEKPRQRPKKLGLGADLVRRGEAARADLDRASPDASPGERILHELVGQEVTLALAVMNVQAEVAARLEHFVDEPAKLVALSRALKELTGICNAIGRRVEGALTTASSLRAQRRLWNLHGVARS